MDLILPGSKSCMRSCRKPQHINTVVLLTVLCFTVYIIYGYHGVYGTTGGTSGGLQDMLVAGMPMIFTALVGMSCAPFLTLLIFSGAGNLLNTGFFNTEGIPFADILMGLPISETNVFVVLLIVTSLKIFVSLVGTGKIICDVSVGKIEELTGAICVIAGPYLVATSVTVQGASLSATGGFFASGAVRVLSIIIPLVAYGMYHVMKTLASAIDIAAFLAAPIPGVTALVTISKHLLVGAYVGLAILSPTAMTVVGLVFFVVAVIVFRWAQRLVRYYKKIYLVSFFKSTVLAGWPPPLVPARLPRRVAAEFENVEICIPAFVMNRTPFFKKRDRCYLVRAGGVNYLYASRLLGGPAKMVLPDDIYIEKLFRFVRFSSDRHLHLNLKGVHVVIGREHATNIEALVQKAGFTHYDEPPRPGGWKLEVDERNESKWKPRRRS